MDACSSITWKMSTDFNLRSRARTGHLQVQRDIKAWTATLLHKIHLDVHLTLSEAHEFVDMQSKLLKIIVLPQAVVSSTIAGKLLGVPKVLKWRRRWLEKCTLPLSQMYPLMNGRDLGVLASAVLDSLLYAGGASVPQYISCALAVLYSSHKSNPNRSIELIPQIVPQLVLETIRFFVPVVGFPWYESKNQKQRTVLSLHSASRDPRVWGEDASEFKLRSMADYHKKMVNWAEGAGTRMCPAKELSYQMGSIFISEFAKVQHEWSISKAERKDIRIARCTPFVDEFVLASRPVMMRSEAESIQFFARVKEAAESNDAKPMCVYEIHIKTGDMTGAGTDSDVYASLIGDHGETKQFKLDNPWKDDNETGTVSKFRTDEIPNVGNLTALRIRRSVTALDKLVIPGTSFTPEIGNSNDWYLSSVAVMVVACNLVPDAANAPHASWLFPCYDWLTRKSPSVLLMCGNANMGQPRSGYARDAVAELLKARKRAYQYTHEHPELGNFEGKLPALCRDARSISSEMHSDNDNWDFGRAALDVVANTGIKALFTSLKSDYSLQDYERVFSSVPNLIPSTRDVRVPKRQLSANDDRAFGYARVGGMNPVELFCLSSQSELPEKFRVSDEDFLNGVRKLYGDDHGIKSLANEIELGTIFVCDFGLIERAGLVGAFEFEGLTRYSAAPFCLLYANAAMKRHLVPVAIQVTRDGNGEDIVWTPADTPSDWRAAKLFVGCADFAVHQFKTHALWSHITQGPVSIALQRCVPPLHPIHKLLRPHMHGLLWINDFAMGALVAKDPTTSRARVGNLLSTLADGNLKLTCAAYEDYAMSATWLRADLKRRNLLRDDSPGVKALGKGGYPFREDSLLLLGSIEGYVGEIVEMFYESDRNVADDGYLAEFFREMSQLGGIKGIPVSCASTKAGLVDFCANAIFTASAFHAAVNFSQIDFGANVFQMPGMLLRPPLRKRGVADDVLIRDMLPPRKWALTQLGMLMFLSQPSRDQLGVFPEDLWGTDARCMRIVDKFQDELRKCGNEIDKRNDALEYEGGLVPLRSRHGMKYEYLHPRNCPSSTNI